MGRKWNKKKKDAATNKVEKPKRERQDPQGYVEVKKENKDFEIYYKSQNLIPEEEWTTFMQCLQSSLPAAFRVTGNTTQAKALLKILKDEYFKPLETISAEDLSLPKIPFTETINGNGSVARVENGSMESSVPGTLTDEVEVANDGAAEEPIVPLEPKCLTWYPEGLAYQLNLSRRSIRRCEAYWRLHQCLISETDAGGISRQEAVSMIPPLLLDVHPHHKVLDMCAAPGSKTAQIIEQLHGSHDPLEGSIPPGVVVANDADNKRCYLLTHQAKRLQSPSIMITNHDASFMPNMFYTRPDGGTGRLKFDRVLCDVPCSGDGTLRKNCDVWAKWNPVNGCNLHGLQLRIARRGLELLAVGGRMVYSTCSLSPMENEAVLQRLLLEAGGAVTLQDCSQQLPGLKYRPGLTKWTVMTKDMVVLPTPADIPIHLSNIYHKHLFPVEEDLHLERCLRLLPHHQDTGGFFVAVLHKTASLPGEGEDRDGGFSRRSQQPPKKRRRQGFKEEPFYYLSDCIAQWERDYRAAKEPTGTAPHAGDTVTVEDQEVAGASGDSTDNRAGSTHCPKESDEAQAVPGTVEAATASDGAVSDNSLEDLRIWSTICTFFGLRKDVPEASFSNFMTRSKEGKKRNLYFTNSLVRNLIDHNQDRMKIINTGVKVLVRTDNKGATCDFRLAQEGVQSLVPLVMLRRVPVSRSDLVHLLTDDDNETPPELTLMSEECQQRAAGLVTGSVLLEYCGDPTVPEEQQQDLDDQDKMKIELVGWKGKNSMRCYVARNDRIHYLRLLRADTSRYVKNKFVAATGGTGRGPAEEAMVTEDGLSESGAAVLEGAESASVSAMEADEVH